MKIHNNIFETKLKQCLEKQKQVFPGKIPTIIRETKLGSHDKNEILLKLFTKTVEIGFQVVNS